MAVATPKIASAACGTSLPFIFSNNVSIVDASTTNANNQFLLNCALAVDNTQIGSAGIYASQIIPTTVGRATFGGTIGYTFPAGLTIAGFTTAGVVTNSTTGVLATTPVLPVANGGTGSATQNFVDLTSNQTIAGSKSFSSASIDLSNTSATSASTSLLIRNVTGSVGLSESLSFQNAASQSAGFSFNDNARVAFTNSLTPNAILFDSAMNENISGSNGILHTTGGTGVYPYDAADTSSNTAEHIERGIISVSTTGTTVTFSVAYSASPICEITPDTPSAASYGIVISSKSSSSVVFKASSTTNADYICIGN